MKKSLGIGITPFILILVIPGFFFIGFLPLPVKSEQPQNPKIEDRLSELENKIEYFLNQGGINKEQLDRQKALTVLEKKLEETALNLAVTEVSFANYYIQIIGLILAFIGAISLLAGFFLKRIVQREVEETERNLRDIVKETENRLKERIEFLSQVNQIIFFRQLSFYSWETYEPMLEAVGSLNAEKEALLLEHIKMAKLSASKGLRIFRDRIFKQGLDKEPEGDDILRTQIHLFNDYVYHAILEIGLPIKFNHSEVRIHTSEKHHIMLMVEKCYEGSKKEIYQEFWYKALETVAFAKVMIGNNSEREEGIKTIKNLVGEELNTSEWKKFTPPSEEWKEKIKSRWENIYKITLSS